jgi:hypothetical protein
MGASNMTTLLKKAFDAASSLPPQRQDVAARIVLVDIEDERR